MIWDAILRAAGEVAEEEGVGGRTIDTGDSLIIAVIKSYSCRTVVIKLVNGVDSRLMVKIRSWEKEKKIQRRVGQ